MYYTVVSAWLSSVSCFGLRAFLKYSLSELYHLKNKGTSWATCPGVVECTMNFGMLPPGVLEVAILCQSCQYCHLAYRAMIIHEPPFNFPIFQFLNPFNCYVAATSTFRFSLSHLRIRRNIDWNRNNNTLEMVNHTFSWHRSVSYPDFSGPEVSKSVTCRTVNVRLLTGGVNL